MNPSRMLIAGCGYVGRALASVLRGQGHEVWTLRRTSMAGDPFALQGDLSSTEHLRLPPDLTHIIFAGGLQRAEPEAYKALFVDGMRNLLAAVAHHPVRRFLFVSTTGVYGEDAGGWVDENTTPQPRRMQAHYYLQAEQMLQEQVPGRTIVARCSGIYGPGRIRLIRSVVEGEATRVHGPIRYLNHIHVEDMGGALAHLCFLEQVESCYVLSDSEPADRNEVLEWFANQLNVDAPPWSDAETAVPDRRGGNKRCRNTRLLQTGYKFRYPTYREGYAPLLSDYLRQRPVDRLDSAPC